MIARLIYKLILALSLLLGIVLLILWSRTRHSDLVASSASGGTYREVRLGEGQVGVTSVTVWPTTRPARWGRVPTATPDDSVVLSTLTTASGTPGGKIKLTMTGRSSFVLLDGSRLSLNPGPSTWWPPAKSTGSAIVSESLTAQSLTKRPGTMAIVGSSASSFTITQSSGSGAVQLNIPGPSTTPASVTLVPGPATLPASVGAITFRGSSITTTTAPVSSTGSLTITGGTLILYMSYRYDRYALPIWVVAMIVLLPVWWAVLVVALRWRRRRSRRRKGLCERCGYDLRGNPSSGACPECGAPTTAVPAPPTGDQLLARLK